MGCDPGLNQCIFLFSGVQCTDHLLCHDDELEGRRVAFILYLVPPWSEQDGAPPPPPGVTPALVNLDSFFPGVHRSFVMS